MIRSTAFAALVLLAGCGNTPDQPSGQENAAEAAAMTRETAEREGVEPPNAVAVAGEGFGTEDAAGDVPDAADTDTRPSPSATPSARATTTSAVDPFAGRWTGVEGMYLAATPTGAPGRYTLDMRYDLDHRTTLPGRRTDEGIAFTRNGEQLVLTRGTGAQTGLKYLAGKQDCLIVSSGEGYCRA